MAVVRPFRALRYAPSAGALEALVAPPYDVIDDAQREELLARSPHNVVHLTLPDSEEEAARTLADWRARGVLVEDDAPAVWLVEQDYVGPDGVARTRTGLAASLTVEPYETRAVLPHERTHAGPKEGRLRLLRATHTQLEPIFLLHDGPAPYARPSRAPDLEVGGARLWRLDVAGDEPLPAFEGRELLIADGHHRYETAVAFRAEQGTPESAQQLVVLVSTEDPGLTIFPTHRVVARKPPLDGLHVEDVASGLDSALARLEALPYDHPAFVLYEAGRASLVTAPGSTRLDVELLDDLGLGERTYTPDAHEAARRVNDGEGEAAFLLRATRIEDVFAVARRGEVMPQKSTYFFPKLVSGLLLHPV